MAATTVETLRAKLEGSGVVVFRLQPAKVALNLFVFVALALGPLAVAWGHHSVFLPVACVWGAWVGVAGGFLYAEQLLGAGPPLQIDRTGITIRRWGRPLELKWNEVLLVRSFRADSGAPLVAISMSEWVWHDYRSGRPVLIRLVDRLTHYRSRCLVLLKVLDAAAADILALADPATIDRLTVFGPPYRLVLDMDETGKSPLWLRGGREAPLDELPLRPDLARAAAAWNHRAVRLLDADPADAAFHRALRETTEEGRSLARRIQAELGPGAEVLWSGDVPRWRSGKSSFA